MYMRQLDGLRCVAVMLVVLGHFGLINGPYAWLGVRLFFVLSGFLITGILLRGTSFTSFYARRTLRIFPLYFAFIGLLWFAYVPAVRDGLWWHLLYVQNYMPVFGPKMQSMAAVDHLWSLAVEEQFYLLWPAVVLLGSRFSTKWAIVLMIAGAPLFRYWAVYEFGSRYFADKSLFGNMDLLAMGAALAYMQHYRIGARMIGLCAPALFALPFVLELNKDWLVVFAPTIIGMACVWLVNAACHGFDGLVGELLELPPVVYIGRISYGIYVLHFLFAGQGNLPMQLIQTLLVSVVSFHFWETPWNNLKRWFPYGRRPASVALDPSPVEA